MARQPRVLIVGGYGVFGRLLAREILETTDARVVIAGRNIRRANEECRALGMRADPVALDLSDPAALAREAAGCAAVVCAAGPFSSLAPDLPAVAARAGAHWFDVADDPAWVLPLLRDGGLDRLARERGVSVIPGSSSAPGLSGALTRWALARVPGARRVRITLFIGNRNRKGAAAIASAIGGGFADPLRVELPVGRRTSYRFATPDERLLGDELAVEAEFRAALEWGVAGRIVAGAGRIGAPGKTRLLAGRALAVAARPFGVFGSDAGVVQVDAWSSGGHVAVAAVSPGQLLAVLPCALAVGAALAGEISPGVHAPGAWLSGRPWMERFAERGVRFLVRDG